MRKWAVPLTCVGLGGLGALLFSEGGRKLIRFSTADRGIGAPGRLAAWNNSAQQELNHIQEALKELEESFGTHTFHK